MFRRDWLDSLFSFILQFMCMFSLNIDNFMIYLLVVKSIFKERGEINVSTLSNRPR